MPAFHRSCSQNAFHPNPYWLCFYDPSRRLLSRLSVLAVTPDFVHFMFLIAKQDPDYTYCVNVLSETNRQCRIERCSIPWVSSEDIVWTDSSTCPYPARCMPRTRTETSLSCFTAGWVRQAITTRWTYKWFVIPVVYHESDPMHDVIAGSTMHASKHWGAGHPAPT